jgi:hypothetical protein
MFSRPFILCLLTALLSLLALLADLRAAAPPPATGPGKETDTSWVWNSNEHGFSLRLPSSDWKKHSRARGVVDFYHSRSSSPMLVGVLSVKKQTREEFRESVKKAQAYVGRDKEDLLSGPTLEEDTISGNLFARVTAYEKGDGDIEYFYFTTSFTWLKEKGITVQVIFEGQGKMRSRFFQAREKAEFEKAARAIQQSVK